jgi:vacuolar-type H+-ATPase subunit I/STV1
MNKNYHNPFTTKDFKEIKQQIKEYNENYDLIQERSDKILEAWNKDIDKEEIRFKALNDFGVIR